jgi:20S proteasome alpha/beta subunit
VKCEDGALLASDSQGEFQRGLPVKRLARRKIYRIDEMSAVAGAGDVSDIQKAVRALRSAFKARPYNRDEDVYVQMIEQTMLTLHKTYNINRSEYLGQSAEIFHPALIFAGQTREGEEKYCLFFAHYDGVAEPINDYVTIGSGAAYAELLLKNYYRTGITLNEAIGVAIYVISRVEETDPSCGGPIQIGILQGEKFGGYKELEPEEISEAYRELWKSLDLIRTELMRRVLRGEIKEERIKEFLS